MGYDGDDPLVALGDEADIDGLVPIGAAGQQSTEINQPAPLFVELDPDQGLAVLLPDQQVTPREGESKGQELGQVGGAARSAVNRVDGFRLRIFGLASSSLGLRPGPLEVEPAL
ncbi:hypothetical protein PG985_004242 [Apiospora marii]|uniref:Uncharacterized protein n=1 Tax=Apiospora marii TaxID=335849 RepID=A0ABR1SA38_9PEZI